MKCWFLRAVLAVFCLAALPVKTPAPLVYTPGEGWTWEPVGGSKWTRTRAKDQLEVAQKAFDEKNFRIAGLAARRTVRNWPLSDYAPAAQFLVARTLEEKGKGQAAFKAYQNLLLKYPKIANYEEVVERQYAIASQFLAGKYLRLWGVIPYKSKTEVSALFEKVVRNGPYSPLGPQAQMRAAEALEKGWWPDYEGSSQLFAQAADRYHHQKEIAADAKFRTALAYHKLARRAEYDQSVAGKAISTYSDFMAMYPEDPRVGEAQASIAALRTEQARGNFVIARYYEKKRKWDGALIYYNESVLRDPESKYAESARQRIELIKAYKIARGMPAPAPSGN